jgi:tRNA threonylcarbamoyladenosine biosynthesis protein TsaE
MIYNLKSTQDLIPIAQELAQLVLNSHLRLICFNGQMGTGKTTLIKELLKQLGSQDHVTSPTFSLVNEYKVHKLKVFHFDLYRIKYIHELEDIGFHDYLCQNGLLLIEWPHLILEYMYQDYVMVDLFLDKNNLDRTIETTFNEQSSI